MTENHDYTLVLTDIHDLVLQNLRELDWDDLVINNSVPFSFFEEHKTYLNDFRRIKLCSNILTPLEYIKNMFQKFDTYPEYKKERLKDYVSKNQNIDVLGFLKTNPQFIDWKALSENPEAISILKDNSDNINITALSRNKKAGDLLMTYVNRLREEIEKENISIRWILSQNSSAFPLLQAYPEFIEWSDISSNEHPDAIEYIEKEKNRGNIYWEESYCNGLSQNESDEAIDVLLLKRPENINWVYLSSNSNPRVIPLLEANLDNICFYGLSRNPNAIQILESNPKIISFSGLSRNTNSRVWEKGYEPQYVLK